MKKLVVFLFCIVAILLVQHLGSDKNVQSALLLYNIEALADNEDTTNHACYGYGDIDCFGIKAKLRIDIFSLD